MPSIKQLFSRRLILDKAIVLFVTLSALVLLPSTARADGYTFNGYTNVNNAGESGGNGQPLTPYTNYSTYVPGGTGWGYTNPPPTQSNLVTDCQGEIDATFQWQSATNAPPPTDVVVVQTSSVAATANGPGFVNPQASCSDGLGNACPAAASSNGSLTTSLTTTKYSQMSGMPTITLKCSPMVNTSVTQPPGSTTAKVDYTAAVYPITIQLAGTSLGGNGSQDILTGQQCTATLQGVPPGCTVTSYSWSASGGKPFETYDTSAPNATHTTQLVPLSAQDMAAQNFSFYDGTNGDSITVNCNAVITTPVGTQLTVTAQSMPIKVLKPTASWGIDPKVVPEVDPNTGKVISVTNVIGFHDDSATQQSFGVNTTWYTDTISVPAPFTGGQGCFAQIVTPNASITRIPQGQGASTYTVKIPGPNGTWIAPGAGLDGNFPYSYGLTTDSSGNITGIANSPYTWAAGGIGASGDNPSGQESAPDLDNGGMNWQTSTISDTFTTWLMYKPPSTQNQGVVWVPLMSASWKASGTASGGPNHWTATGSYSAPSPSNTNSYPSWTLIIQNQQYRP